MRRFGAWRGPAVAVTAALALGVFTCAAPAQPPPVGNKPGESPGLFGRLFGAPAKPGPKQEAGPKPNAAKQTAAQLQEELAAYNRRCQVCDRLREVAQETGDEKLRDKADELEAQAFKLYQERTAHLPTGRGSKSAGAEAALDSKLGSDPAADAKRLTGSAPAGRQTASREVKP
jgi:hypothetical protein